MSSRLPCFCVDVDPICPTSCPGRPAVEITKFVELDAKTGEVGIPADFKWVGYSCDTDFFFNLFTFASVPTLLRVAHGGKSLATSLHKKPTMMTDRSSESLQWRMGPIFLDCKLSNYAFPSPQYSLPDVMLTADPGIANGLDDLRNQVLVKFELFQALIILRPHLI